MLLRRPGEGAAEIPRERRLSRRFWQGVVVNILNPKTALFFFAFLPQFVDPDKGSAALQIGVLGLVFVVLAVTSDSMWALAAGTASERLRGNRRFLAVQRYIGLGVLRLWGAHRGRQTALAPTADSYTETVIYCVIPRELEGELFEKMLEYYKDNPNVTVIVNRREGDDRRNGREYGGKRELRDRRRARIPGTFPDTDAGS